MSARLPPSSPDQSDRHARETAARQPVPGKWRAALLYTALAVVTMYPISTQPGQVVAGNGPDTQLGLYVLSWDVHAFASQPLSIFDANAFYPQPRTLAYQDNLIGSALIAAPILWATGNPVLALNLVCVIATILCGVGGYVLARRIGLSEPAALLCGLIFGFCPPRFFRYSQVGLAPVQWIPLSLASLHAYLDGGRKRDLRIAAALVTLQTLTSSHAAVFLVTAILVMLLVRVCLGEPLRPVQRLRDLGVPGLLLFVPALLSYLPYRLNQREFGLRRDLTDWTTMYESFLASPTYVHAKLLAVAGLSRINDEASGFLFPGYLPVALSVVAVAAACAAAVRWCRTQRVDTLRLPAELGIALVSLIALLVTAPRLFLEEGVSNPVVDWRGLLPWFALALGLGVFARVFHASHRSLVNLRSPIRLLAIGVIAWTVMIAVRTAVPAANGLRGQYHSGSQWAEPPLFAATDARPSTRTLHQRRTRVPDAFSVRWRGFLTLPDAGAYIFSTTSDDGSQLWIDGRLVVDNGGDHARQTVRGHAVALDEGPHAVIVEYSQAAGDAVLEWSFQAETGIETPVAGWMLSQRRASRAMIAVARAVDGLARVSIVVLLAGSAWLVLLVVRGRWETWSAFATPLRHGPMPVYLTLTLVCIALAMGPPYGIWQYVYAWPGFSFIRAPLRFMVLGVLGFAVLSAAGFDRLAARRSIRAGRVLALVLGTLMVAEFFGAPLFGVPYTVEIPAADRWLAAQPTPFVVAEVPVGPERYQTTYMLHSTAHWQRTVAGYGGIRPPLNETLNQELRVFPDPASLSRLQQLGVTHVVVHIDYYASEDWPPVEARLRQYEGGVLTRAYEDATSRVYSLRAP